MFTIDRLIELKGVIKWNAVFAEAGLNPNTMRSAVHHQRDLREEEASAILAVLSRYGLALAPQGPRVRRADACVRRTYASRSPSRVPVGNHG